MSFVPIESMPLKSPVSIFPIGPAPTSLLTRPTPSIQRHQLFPSISQAADILPRLAQHATSIVRHGLLSSAKEEEVDERKSPREEPHQRDCETPSPFEKKRSLKNSDSERAPVKCSRKCSRVDSDESSESESIESEESDEPKSVADLPTFVRTKVALFKDLTEISKRIAWWSSCKDQFDEYFQMLQHPPIPPQLLMEITSAVQAPPQSTLDTIIQLVQAKSSFALKRLEISIEAHEEFSKEFLLDLTFSRLSCSTEEKEDPALASEAENPPPLMQIEKLQVNRMAPILASQERLEYLSAIISEFENPFVSQVWIDAIISSEKLPPTITREKLLEFLEEEIASTQNMLLFF